jgi:iron-sulfur cluster assembly accessory protein
MPDMSEKISENIKITVSEKAKKHYAILLEKNPEAIGIRLFTKKAGCSGLMYQSELIYPKSLENGENSEDFLVFNQEKIKIFVSRKSMPYLNGICIDIVQKMLGQSQVVYENPNEVARCGCGESFKVKD